MLLYCIEAAMNEAAEVCRNDWQRDHRQKREQCEQRVDAKHDTIEKSAPRWCGEVHDWPASSHPDRTQVVVSRAMMSPVRCRQTSCVERDEMREKVVRNRILFAG